MLSGHVDDFLFAGPSDDKDWDNITQAIQTMFRWTDWEENDFIQCGVRAQRQSDGSFHLSQTAYVDKIPEIFLSANRRKETEQATTDREKTALRATLGGLSWQAQETAPHFSAEV